MCIMVLMTLYFQNTSDLHATSYMYVLMFYGFFKKKIVKLSLISSEILQLLSSETFARQMQDGQITF